LLGLASVYVIAPAQNGQSMTKADVDRDLKELSNWGRLG